VALLAKKSDKFTGAEIEECVKDAMFAAFDENREFQTNDILRAVKNTHPIAERSEELLDPIRKWAEDHARPVARPKVQKESANVRHIRKSRKED